MDIVAFKNKFENKPVLEYSNNVGKNALVSICVQTYQHSNFIKDCLDSILQQKTNFTYEILLGEDASNDGTREICIEYAEKFPDKIKLFLHHRENNIKIDGSPSGRFNFMYNLYSARGKYIALCEGDDYWTDPLKLQKQVDFLENNLDYNICFHEMQIKDESNNSLIADTITRKVENSTTSVDLVKGNFMHTPSVVLRNDFTVPDWFHESPIGDWVLYMLVVKDKKIKKINEVMGVYRSHAGGVWSLKSKEFRIKNTLKSFKLVADNLQLEELTKIELNSKINYFEKTLKNIKRSNNKNSLFKRIFKKIFK